MESFLPTIISALAGIAGIILGILAQRHFDRQDRQARHQEWLDEFRLPRQLDTLSTLYADSVHLQAQITGLGVLKLSNVTREEITEARTAYNQYEKSAALAYIYLSEKGRTASDHYGTSAFILISAASLEQLGHGLPDSEPFLSDEQFKANKQKVTYLHEELVNLLQQELVATNTSATNRKKA
ncbi:MAG: hypothetical protein M3441_05365 [Chloroflexota bacterium]|nr:hypothetical protein [Chloroflexota bacterium]